MYRVMYCGSNARVLCLKIFSVTKLISRYSYIAACAYKTVMTSKYVLLPQFVSQPAVCLLIQTAKKLIREQSLLPNFPNNLIIFKL